jgi:voltage-gated potassium channel
MSDFARHLAALRHSLRGLYFGASETARRFRYGLVVFDLVTIGAFLLIASVPPAPWVFALDLILAALLAAEFGARLLVATNKRRFWWSWTAAADVIVIFSLLAATFIDNLGFLRALRLVTLLRSYHLMRDLRQDSHWFDRHEEVIQRALTLVVFVFLVSGFVFVTQNGVNPNMRTYLDALYFTVTSLTTTGYGDLTLVGAHGRLLSILIMVAGVSLFIRLIQAIFRPDKVRHPCPACGLIHHDPDAVHCKHCGLVLNIPNEG